MRVGLVVVGYLDDLHGLHLLLDGLHLAELELAGVVAGAGKGQQATDLL